MRSSSTSERSSARSTEEFMSVEVTGIPAVVRTPMASSYARPSRVCVWE
ncbi:hypothetical protein ACU4GG_01245 [Streptomyces nojiriensis]